jgi:hypothetical protein
MPLLQLTAAYSNAVLVAVLPHISDCAKQLDLPIVRPITVEQVEKFNASPYTNNVGGGLWLTNHFWFVFSFGAVNGFRSPDDWFTIQDFDNIERFAGKDNITTNAAVDLARSSFSKLGYQPEIFHVNEQPTSLEVPSDSKKLGHVPYCRIIWKSPEATTREERLKSYSVQFDIDMQRAQVVGMSLSGTNFWRQNLEIDFQPDLESFRTNVPPHLNINTGLPPHIPLKKE